MYIDTYSYVYVVLLSLIKPDSWLCNLGVCVTSCRYVVECVFNFIYVANTFTPQIKKEITEPCIPHSNDSSASYIQLNTTEPVKFIFKCDTGMWWTSSVHVHNILI